MLEVARSEPSEGLSASARRRGVFLLALTEPVSWGILYYAIGALLEPMRQDLGLEHTPLAASVSLGLIVAGLFSPKVGGWIDRLGPRRMMTTGSALAVVSLLLWSQTPSLLGFALAMMLAGLAQSMVLYEPAFTAVAQWIPDAKGRGRALGVITTTGGIASTIFVPLTLALERALDWRAAVLVLAGIVLVLTVPAHACLPESGRRLCSPDAPTEAPPTFPRSLAWFSGALGLHALSTAGFAVYFVTLSVAQGFSTAAIASAAALFGLMQLPARWFVALSARARGPRALVVATSLQGAAAVVLGLATTAPALYAGACLFGLGNGALTILRAGLVADWYGLRHYGAANGVVGRAALFGRAAGPFVAGFLWSQSGRPGVVFGAVALASAGSAVLLQRARRVHVG